MTKQLTFHGDDTKFATLDQRKTNEPQNWARFFLWGPLRYEAQTITRMLLHIFHLLRVTYKWRTTIPCVLWKSTLNENQARLKPPVTS